MPWTSYTTDTCGGREAGTAHDERAAVTQLHSLVYSLIFI